MSLSLPKKLMLTFGSIIVLMMTSQFMGAIAQIAAIAMSALIVFLLSRRIVGDLNLLLARAKAIAEGDLTGERSKSRSSDGLGELGASFDQIQNRLQTMVSQLGSTASDVASTATQMAATAEQMDASMQQQKNQTTEVLTSVGEMSSTVLDVASKSSEAATTAEGAGEQAQHGGEVVRQTIQSIGAIAEVVNDSAQAIGELGRRGEQIGQIIEVIDDIADQTNLLALNAAIEAARAGEHGRGFAVVADEVRKLAERTTGATKEVAESIKAIQEKTGKAVVRMADGTERVDSGVKLAEQAGHALQQIVSSSNHVSREIRSIASMAESQSIAAEQISRNVDGINAALSQSVEGTSQTASTAAIMSTKAEQYQQLLDMMKIKADPVRVPRPPRPEGVRPG